MVLAFNILLHLKAITTIKMMIPALNACETAFSNDDFQVFVDDFVTFKSKSSQKYIQIINLMFYIFKKKKKKKITSEK